MRTTSRIISAKNADISNIKVKLANGLALAHMWVLYLSRISTGASFEPVSWKSGI